MKSMSVLVNASTGRIVATRMHRLSTFFQPAVARLPLLELRIEEGVWITPCRTIHTFGMRTASDVILVDSDSRVVRVDARVRPNSAALSCLQAEAVVELGGGALTDVWLGDELVLI